MGYMGLCPARRGLAPHVGALVAALLLLASGCGQQAKLPPLAAQSVVLAFGDSLTYGTGAGEAESYPAQLAIITGRHVVSEGVPGEVSAAGLERLPALLDEHRPRLLILCHGGNDFLHRLDDARTEENLRAMIRNARDRGIPVVLLATPKPTFPPSVPGFYRGIAAEQAIPFEEAVLREVLFDNRLKSDLVHPNGQGYARVASAIEKLLRRSGAL